MLRVFGAALTLALLVVSVQAQPAQPAAAAPAESVLVVVDETVYPHIEAGLRRYFDHVGGILPIRFKVLEDDFYNMPPDEIRAVLQQQYEAGDAPVVGVILVGPIPHAVRGDPKPFERNYFTPMPLFYEDFQSRWYDENNDGYFERLETDRANNPTEVWTAWWTPPANEPANQIKLLQGYLDKLDRYYTGEIVGRDGMIFIAGNGNSVEITEAWFVLMNDALRSTGQKVAKVFSRYAQMKEQALPEEEEFKPDDLEHALEEGRYQHVHILTHGAPDGFYWEQAAIRGTRLNYDKFNQSGANIITTSGCSNGNFRGNNFGPADYARSIGNALVFNPNTMTVVFMGATSPQSTGVFATNHTEMIEQLDPQLGGYFGKGYYNWRNTDYSWGTQHWFFRGVDGKALIGDPFARYHQPTQVAGAQADAVQTEKNPAPTRTNSDVAENQCR